MSKNKEMMVSHGALLEELARRIVAGWRPAIEDQEYFSELVFNLLANQRSIERAVRGQEKHPRDTDFRRIYESME